MKFLFSIEQWLMHQSWFIKMLLILLVVGICYGAYLVLGPKQAQQTEYQTEQAQKGSLIISITASGTVASTNARSVETDATGVVKKLFVKDGDTVKIGQAIASIELDQLGKQKAAQALSSYQSAKSSVESAKANLYSLQSKMFAANQKFINDAVARSLAPEDPSYIQQDADWLASEVLYKNQQNAINQAQNSLSSAWLSYQASSPTISSPISGKISGLSLQQGTVIDSGSSSSTGTSGTKVASIITDAAPTISIDLTEIDVSKVHIEDKATITFDTFPDKTFTGKVISVDTVGAVSSGVTTYPVTVKLDTNVEGLFSNMAATASIITQVKDDVVLIPLSSVQTTNGQSTVRVMNNGQVESKNVVLGLSSDTQTEVVSGINEGEVVVTSAVSPTAQTSGTQTRSVFSTLGGSRGGSSSGNAVRIAR
ncbi:MAG: efflux RND transporter periplasmic adaptor subunit [Patescibacteria group bacterium]